MGRRVLGARVRGRAALLVVTVIALGTVVLAPEGVTASEGGFQLETFELPSPLVDPTTPGGRLERGRTAPKVHVLLPDGYADHPDQAYPVLWLLHGANGGTDTWIPEVTEHLAGLPAVVVMPDGGTFGMYVDWWNGGRRGGPAWATYHLDLLRRTVEERYRILPGRRWHAIAGISMGGQGALRYAAMLPGYFGSVAGFSAALPDMQALDAQVGVSLVAAASARDGASHEAIFGPARAPYAEGNSPKALAANLGHTRIYLTSGTGINCPQDPVNLGGLLLDTITELFIHLQQAPFAAAASAHGADVTARSTCGIHTFGVWDRAFVAVRDWGFFGEVPEAPEEWVYRTIATAGEMWGMRYTFSSPPSSVARFERIGALLFATGDGEVTITGAPGCELRITLPIVALLPTAC